MPVRAARVHDLPTLSSILAEAFYDEEFTGPIMHPHRKSYPQDYHHFWEHNVSEWYWDYSHQLNVTYTVKNDGERHEEVLTGVGDWVRHGKGWEHYWGIWGKWDPRNIMRRLVLLRHRIVSYWQPNRAADPKIHHTIATLSNYTMHLWSGKRDTGWYLNYLAVDSAYQNKGYGTALAKWGVERAKEENVTASVICALDKQGFYHRCGFEAVGGRISDGEGNPLKGIEVAGLVLFCDPKSE